jgi:hypothetical protein
VILGQIGESDKNLTPHNFGHSDNYALKFSTFASLAVAFPLGIKGMHFTCRFNQNRVKFQAKYKSRNT